ncbi:hemoglobin [Paraflavitalea soli]|uniref:Hemoglobin n=1 Tax=Paraflavitalea soli TaxID=2315862 RepID=A0A3B7MIK3_9BACT|nr:globin domain-containing protein [Paraflavitalea soli]AXY72876.1 hemoglobin [Paraflavitalea soli]
MTKKQIQLIQRSWRLFQQIKPTIVGDVFYSKLFVISPSLQKMFGTDMNAQHEKLMEMLSLIVTRLDNLDVISAEITDLAVRHIKYGVIPAYYKMVGEALLWTLEHGLGNDWNEELKEAWEACYKKLAAAMLASV